MNLVLDLDKKLKNKELDALIDTFVKNLENYVPSDAALRISFDEKNESWKLMLKHSYGYLATESSGDKDLGLKKAFEKLLKKARKLKKVDLHFVSRGVEISEELKEFTLKKLPKIINFLHDPIDIKVILGKEGELDSCEIIATHAFGTLVSKEVGQVNVLEAITKAVEKLEKQARRSKKKSTLSKRHNNRKIAQPSVADFGDNTPKIVELSPNSLKPMNIEEALLELEESDRGFVIYIDMETECLSLLFKMDDGNLGIVKLRR